MRSLNRPAIPIPTLVDTGIAGRKRRSHRDAFDANGVIPETFDDHWNNADVRGLLHAMQAHICAYCGLEERTLDVEHFRPKGAIHGEPDSTGYWWLAYESSNYFFGCPACNQKRKGTRFPVGGVRVTYTGRHQLPQEPRTLLDPVEDSTVEDSFHLAWNDPTCEILPSPALTPDQKNRISDVIDFFNLNMDATVRTRRSKTYEDAIRAAHQNDWAEVRRMAMRHREHSFVARFVLLELNQPLPTPDEETSDLTNRLWRDLREQVKWIQDLQNRNRQPAPQDLRQMKSYAWALVVLQNHGAASQRNIVEALLADRLTYESDATIAGRIIRLFQEIAGELP